MKMHLPATIPLLLAFMLLPAFGETNTLATAEALAAADMPADDFSTPHAWENSFAGFHAKYIKGKLEVGTRSTSYDFDQTQKGDRETRIGTYFGTINELQPKEDSSPTRIYVQYAFVEYAGVGVTWDDVRLATKDGPSEAETDGDVTVDSQYIYVFGRYPNATKIVPFVEIGKGYHDIGFLAEPNWGRRNSLTLGDADATFFSYGVELWLTPNLSVNVMQRQTSFTTTGEYRNIDGRAPTPVEMKLDHKVTGLGVKFTF